MLNQAIAPEPGKRFATLKGSPRGIHGATDEPAPNRALELDDIWLDEAEKRLVAYREGRLEGIPAEEIFSEE